MRRHMYLLVSVDLSPEIMIEQSLCDYINATCTNIDEDLLKITYFATWHLWSYPWCPHNFGMRRAINSSPPNATYMRQWTGSALVQVMACRLFGARPLPELMPSNCRLDPWEPMSVKIESKQKHFHSRICIWKCRLLNGGHCVQGEMS